MTGECPSCGEAAIAAVATAPGFEQYSPCGCRVAADGGSVQDDPYNLSDVATDELQDEFQDLSQEAYDTRDPDGVDYGRMHAIWSEIEDRLDADYPACPGCGAEEWTQSPGEPKRCGECGRELRADEEEIRRVVDDEWTRVARTGDDSE